MSPDPVVCVVAPNADDRAQLRMDPPAADAELWAVYDHRSDQPNDPRPPMSLHVRVQDARRGSSLERVALRAARRRAPWIAFWFPRSGAAPHARSFDSIAENCKEADVLIVPDTSGLCRVLAFRRAPVELLRSLQWQTAPDAEDLRLRALQLGLSCYRYPDRP